MSSTFDPTTAYSQSWKYQRFIESVTWQKQNGDKLTGLKAKLSDSNNADIVSLTGGIGLNTEQAGFVVWQPNSSNGSEPAIPFAPASGDILRRETKGGEGWLVTGVKDSRFGHWTVVCEREVVNG